MNGVRYSDYRIKGERLFGRGEWQIFPLDFASYTLNLQKVKDDQTLLRFAREFGFLGYEQLAKRNGPRNAYESKLDAKQLEKMLRRIRPFRSGEPVAWILAHARTMRTAVNTHLLLREFRATRKREFLFRVKEIWRKGPFAIRGSLVDKAFDADQIAYWQRGKGFPSEQWGVEPLYQFLSGNLKGIHLRLAFDFDCKPKVDFGFVAPIEGAYRQLLEEITTERVGICKNCQEIFKVDRTDQQHCTVKCRQTFATREFRKRNPGSPSKRNGKA